jgi:hypothetical protein
VLSHLRPIERRAPAPGNLELSVEPADARVEVDGVEQGRASDFDGQQGCLNLAPGPHRLTLSKSGYRTLEFTVYASQDGRESLHLELESQSR